jgi:hypothetical protein
LKPAITPIQFTLAVLTGLCCSFIIYSYASISYATFTQRPGLNGDWYYYYHVNRIAFAWYNFHVAMVALLIITRLSFSIYKKDKTKLVKSLILFSIFLAILVLCEIYLNTRFTGKG